MPIYISFELNINTNNTKGAFGWKYILIVCLFSSKIVLFTPWNYFSSQLFILGIFCNCFPARIWIGERGGEHDVNKITDAYASEQQIDLNFMKREKR